MKDPARGFLVGSALCWALAGLSLLHNHHHHVFHVWPVASRYFFPLLAVAMGWLLLGFAVLVIVVWLVSGND